jgi:ABC-type amino acid transport substrate-binding protein
MSKKHIFVTAFMAVICIAAAGCGQKWHYDPITDVNDLEGRRVGVNLSWEADYMLTGREDMQVVRYDTTADMIMALSSDKIDAMAIDSMTWALIDSVSEGIEKVEPAFSDSGYMLYFGPDDKELADDFNSYLAEFKKTEDFKEFMKRVKNFDGVNYKQADITLTGKGDTINVAVDTDGFPHNFYEPGKDEPVGYDIEALKHYANARDRKLVFYPSTYNDAIAGLNNGLYDVYVGYIGNIYREEVENSGLYTSDDLYEDKMYCVQKTQAKISGQLDDIG